MFRLPPLKSLLAFEAVARRLSVTRAADELRVTQSAVSQQIRILEDNLGFLLFTREPQGLALTERGRALAEPVSKAFSIMDQAIKELENVDSVVTFTISTSFAMAWLIPRFSDFETNHHSVTTSLQITQGGQVAEFRNPTDLEVVYCPENRQQASVTHLFDEYMIPVCAPKLLGERPYLDFADMARVRMLLNDESGKDWRVWAEKMQEWPPMDKAVFTQAFDRAQPNPTDVAAIEMATAGNGVCLANLHYVQDRLKLKSLVPAFKIAPVKIASFGFKENASGNRDSVKALVAWLKAAAEKSSVDIKKLDVFDIA